jgi:large subunit ribosomal protein L22
MARKSEVEGIEARAVAKYVRISPFKARQAVDLIRGKDVEEALSLLKFSLKRSARVVEKVLNSATANAEKNQHIARDRLYIAKAFVDEGPTLKRFRARAMGRVARIRKRTSHITIVLKEKES